MALLENDLLLEKYKVQKEINDKSNNDIHLYFQNTKKIVSDLYNNKKIKFKYSKLEHN